MKVYVRGYGPEPEPKVPKDETQQEREARDVRSHLSVVEYSPEPEWKIPAREMAAVELLLLQQMRVHVGLHFCEFSVEELPDDEFAIVCLSHPALATR